MMNRQMSPESPTPFEKRASDLQVRLNDLYTRFGVDELREIPDAQDPNGEQFKLLSAQRGTREWLALKLKTLQGMISQGSTGYDRALAMAEQMIVDWEKIESLEKLDQPSSDKSVDELKKAA